MNKKYQETSAVPLFCEFVNTIIHSFLYSRNLYPHQAFELRKKYGVPINICIHNEVRSYIDSITRSLASILEEHRIEKIEIVIIDTTKDAIKEKLVIEPMSLPRFELAVLTVDEMFKLEQLLRASLLKLIQSFASRPDLKMGSNCTWKVKVCSKMAVYLSLLEKQKTSGELFWIFEEDGLDSKDKMQSDIINDKDIDKKEEEEEYDEDGPFTIVPLKNIKSGFLEVCLHIEDFSCQEL